MQPLTTLRILETVEIFRPGQVSLLPSSPLAHVSLVTCTWKCICIRERNRATTTRNWGARGRGDRNSGGWIFFREINIYEIRVRYESHNLCRKISNTRAYFRRAATVIFKWTFSSANPGRKKVRQFCRKALPSLLSHRAWNWTSHFSIAADSRFFDVDYVLPYFRMRTRSASRAIL